MNTVTQRCRPLLVFLIAATTLTLTLILTTTSTSSLAQDTAAYPSPYGGAADSGGGGVGGGGAADITHKFTPDTPSGITENNIGQFLQLAASMKNGSLYNFSEIKLPAHAGTHVDSPGHMFDDYFDAGFDVDSLDLEVLNGPALLVDVPRDSNVTAGVMKSLNIPKGVKRVLFRTLNTDRHHMLQRKFDTSFVGFKKDKAQCWWTTLTSNLLELTTYQLLLLMI